MEMHEVASGVLTFVREEGQSSRGMIRTSEGIILVDTTARPMDLDACLMAARATPEVVCYILITHSHSDHTSGIPMFDCPVMAHKLTRQRIKKRGT